jgi:hypothetical protein
VSSFSQKVKKTFTLKSAQSQTSLCEILSHTLTSRTMASQSNSSHLSAAASLNGLSKRVVFAPDTEVNRVKSRENREMQNTIKAEQEIAEMFELLGSAVVRLGNVQSV